MTSIQNAIYLLEKYVAKQGFKGYDPYDILNSSFPFHIFGKYFQALVIQIHKRNPINFRFLLGIKKDYNPKGLGLLLHAYSLLYQISSLEEYREKMDFLFEWLCNNKTRGYSGYCWGYNFAWANPQKVLLAFHPSIVVTSFVGKGIFSYYQATKEAKAKEVLNGISEFILKDLPITKNENGICFSYTDVVQDCCYNASMLGAEILSLNYFITKNTFYLEKAKEAVDFVLAYQHADGHWNYSIDLETGVEDKQLDFHQGFVINSLHAFIKFCNCNEKKYKNALLNASDFYLKEQFFEDGRSKWRLPKKYPLDIHNQAQGIISFSNLKRYSDTYFNFALIIAEWTMNNMCDKKGYFYYRKHKLYTNKISYMRWSQAWMLLALAHLSYSSER